MFEKSDRETENKSRDFPPQIDKRRYDGGKSFCRRRIHVSSNMEKVVMPPD